MMVETMLESSQDFGMSNGALPQWKRELLQRRAARSRPAPPQPPPQQPPAQPPPDDDEELRYGPGIVKRLKSRYLSLALRDAPRRRPSVLRRATSLEHLLDERPPPATRAPAARPPRPASVAAPPAALAPSARREVVKRARSVDALSRLDSRDEVPHPPSPSPPPPQLPPPSPPVLAPPPVYTPPPVLVPPPVHAAPPAHEPPPPPHAPPPPPPAPRPPIARTARPPRRPTPLLRDTERPPPDVVRSALRKFESAPTRRTAPAGRVSAVLRGLEAPSRTSTPEPRDPPLPRSPTPPLAEITPSIIEEPEIIPASVEARPVSRAALEGIARAGSSMRFAFEAPKRGSHLPPLAATNSVLIGRARRVGVIRPMPAPTLRSPEPADLDQKLSSPPSTPRLTSPPPAEPEPAVQPRLERRDPPPAALVEPIPRSPPELETTRADSPPEPAPEPMEIRQKEETKQSETIKIKQEIKQKEEIRQKEELRKKIERPLINGFTEPKQAVEEPASRLGGADIERAWNGTSEKKVVVEKEKKPVEVKEVKEVKSGAPWAGGGGGSPLIARRPRAPPPAATSIVFNFSDRKEVPDYIENDGIVLRGSRKNRIKAGEPGVVVLRPELLAADSEEESECDGPPSPCAVRFVNDNVLINGRSSMPDRPNRDRISKLKLQFDDSLTRTFEYPSETSLCEEPEEAHPAHATHASLSANTHIVSAALARYTPSKTVADAFQLGVTRHDAHHDKPAENGTSESAECVDGACADARPCCADAARSWSEARTHATDLLF